MKAMIYLYLLIYVIILLLISWIISRKASSEDFLIANRSRKWWTVALSKFAGAVGVGYFITYTGYAYEYGLSVYLVLIGSFIGYSIFGLWGAPRIYKNSRENKFYTQGDFVEHKTKNIFSKRLTNVVGNIIIFSWLMVGVVGGAKIINSFGGISYEIALIMTVLFVTAYILIAGFKAVIATDVLQAVIIIVLIAGLTWVITQGVGVSQILSAQTGKIELTTSIGFLLFGVLSTFSYSNFYQLIYAAKNKKAASIGIMSSVVPIIFIAFSLLVIGMYMFTQNPNLDSGLVFLEALKGHLPTKLLPIGIVLFFAGLMSSADTNTYAIASHYVLSKKKENPVFHIRKTTIFLGLLSILIGLFIRDVVDITVLAASISVSLSVGMIYLVAGGINKYRFIGSVVTSLLFFVVSIPFIGIEPTLILPVIVGSLLGLIYNGKKVAIPKFKTSIKPAQYLEE